MCYHRRYVYEYAAVEDKQLAATYCINERTNRQTWKYVMLYIKMRRVYPMTLVLSSNDNDGPDTYAKYHRRDDIDWI